jgi:hypothetical protein
MRNAAAASTSNPDRQQAPCDRKVGGDDRSNVEPKKPVADVFTRNVHAQWP